MDDPHDLHRFVTAQNQGGIYDTAVAELRSGHKRSHWMWFVFPQVAGLGSSPMARRYAIDSKPEARAYVDHPVLGPRLLDCCRLVLRHAGQTADEILGGIDAMKLRSSMSLFDAAAPETAVFGEVLRVFFGGEEDPATAEILERAGGR